MASKTVFVPQSKYPFVREVDGYRNPRATADLNVLEISTRSRDTFGKSLSPFNLHLELKSGKRVKIECAYQGSKVLADGSQFESLYWGSPRDAALDRRIKGQAPIAFRFFGKNYPLEPKHAFFNFLYIVGLVQRGKDLFQTYNRLAKYDGFSDIFYSPRKDVNCQGRAAAIFVSLVKNKRLTNDTPSQEILQLLCGK